MILKLGSISCCSEKLVATAHLGTLLIETDRRAPNSLPLAGNGIHFLKARHKLFAWFVKCEREFGLETFEIHVPSLPPGVVINDPKNLEFVFKNESVFQKGDFFKSRSSDLFGTLLLLPLPLPSTSR